MYVRLEIDYLLAAFFPLPIGGKEAEGNKSMQKTMKTCSIETEC